MIIIIFLSFIYISYVAIKLNKKNYVALGSVVGLFYFNIIPFMIFILNDGVSGLDVDTGSRLAMIPDPSKSFDKIIYYCICIYFMLYSIIIYSNSKKYNNIGEERENKITAKVMLVLIIIFWVLNLVKDSLIPSNVVHWAEKAHYFNEHFGLIANIFNFFLVGMKFYLLIISTNFYRYRQNFAVSILLITGLIDVVYTANRIFALLVGLILFIIFIKQKKYILVFILGIISVPMVLFMNLWPYIRSTMSYLPFMEVMEKALDILMDSENLFVKSIFSMTEGGDFLVSLCIVDDFPERHDYFYGTSLLKIFTFMIPRTIWEDKWDSIAIEMANVYDPYNVGFSLATTLLGELYANGGYIGVLIFPFFLFHLFSIFFNALKKISSQFDYSFLAFSMSFLVMRSNFSDVFLLLISISVYLLIFNKFIKG